MYIQYRAMYNHDKSNKFTVSSPLFSYVPTGYLCIETNMSSMSIPKHLDIHIEKTQ